ncbi:MAG: hypothetical protein HY820_23725 [Acidobacteria bacterium]|nr:hypothetical protein [Acidobacteriota bacterium]
MKRLYFAVACAALLARAQTTTPVLASIFPAGGGRGSTVEVTLNGTAITPESILVSGEGVTARIVKVDPKIVRIALDIAPNAEPGMRELRVVNAGGVSNRARFVISDLPEINEIEPNSLKSTPQKITSLPIVINGQITEADRDYFQLQLPAGRRLVFKAEARRLLPFLADGVPGWFDPLLVLYDETGRQVHLADDFHIQSDPEFFFEAPSDGTYTLEIRDVIFRGRADFVYRLSIGELPEVTAIFPLGGTRGTEVPIELYGVNLEERHLQIQAPDDGTRLLRLTANKLPFSITPLPSIREIEPNDTDTLAQRITLPAVIDGRIGKPGESDYYVFAAAKDQRLVMEVQARRLDSPLDSILTLYAANRTVLAENDDWVDPLQSAAVHHADSRIVYTFRAAGSYVLRIRDIQGNGGEAFAYRLSIAPPNPDFHLRITPDNPQLSLGDTAAITVAAVRQDEFNGDIQLSVEDMPEGFEASQATIPAGQNEGRLTITAPIDGKTGIVHPSIYGTALAGKDTVRRKAQSAEAMMQAFAYTHYLPTEKLLLAVTPPSPFRLIADAAKPIELKPSTETPIKIKIARQKGITGGVAFAPIRIANGQITTKSVFVPPDQDEATIILTAAKEAKPGLQQNVIVSGVMRVGPSSITRYARAIPIQIVP